MEQRKIPDHIETPSSIRLGVSQVDKRRLGSFSTCSIAKGTEFGPYKGKIVYDKLDETVDPKFSWKVFDLTTFKYLHTVDATCPADGNWMRYVCCARYFEEQNIVSTQNGTNVYYRALKDIESGEELLTWFEQKKKKRKKSSVRNSNDSDEMPRVSSSSSLQTYSDTPPQSPGKTKRKRKPKIIPDAYEGPIDWEDQEQKAKKTIVKEDEFEPLQPGQKRRRRKKPSIDSVGNVDSNVEQKPIKSSAEIDDKKSSTTNETDGVFDEIGEKEGDIDGNIEDSDSKNASFNSETSLANSVEGKKETSHLSIAEINNSVEWEFPKAGEEYNFELKKHHVVKDNGKKIYRCDICLGLYKHMFSLKRHYLRNHINYKYISKADMTNCLINLMQAKQQMKTKLAALADLRTFKVKPDSNNLKTHLSETQIDNQAVNSLPAVEVGDVVNINQANVNGMKPELDLKNETSVKDSEKSEEMHSKAEHVVNDINDGKNDDANIDKDNSSQDGILDNKLKPEVVEPAISHQSENNTTDNLLSDDKLKQDSHNKPDDVDTGSEKNSQDAIDKNNVMTSMPGLFRCYTCYLTFDDFEGIREHTQNHPEQMEGECFPCDLCSMRFNYKHNLIRHKKTHFSEDSIKATTSSSSSSSAATSVTSTRIGQGHDKPSPKKHLLPSKVKPSPEKKPGLLPSVFRCGVCPQKFDTQQLVVKHVEEEHKNGSKFQCIYCGKDFLSMPNMKKHVRFHLGYRATCKICSEAFSNVGALRKHTRVVHPEDYRAKLIERLQKYGVLKGPDKNALSKEVIDKISSDHKASKLAEQPKEAVEPVKKEKVKSESNSPVPEKEEEIDHEINFTADEIDDGGSRFKFACTVCKKRFSSYINMCRHRRKVHSNENRHRTIECLTFGRKPRVNPSPILENPLDVAAFFANISHNIATNLNCYIDGKSESLKSFASHIKVEDYNGSFGYSVDSEVDVKLSLNQYNFPQGFKLVETISFADIKNNLNIHNDFDSHCTSAAADFPENNECVQEQTESAEDSEVRKINSVKEVDDNFRTMKTTSQGFKVLANVGSMLSKKGSAPFLHGDKEMVTENGPHVNLKIPGGQTYHNPNLPAAHTFHQIERGEYANFQDDLTGDMDNPIAVRSQSVSSSRSWSSKRSYRQKEAESTEDEDRLSPTSLTKTLVKDAQGELEALYDDIDNMKPVQNVNNNNNKTPNSLSSLCEKVLGLRSVSKEKKASTLTNEVATHLKLSTKEDRMNGPDFSDVPEDSPFYNYDTIMFGRNGQIEQICAICRRRYSDVDHLLRHHMKKHPASVCSFLEVENGNDIEDLHFSQPCPIGALAVTDPGLESVSELPGFRCTNCDSTFPTMSKLHIHIVNCSSIDPLYGVKKSEKSPMKTTFRKKFQKKIFNMFGSSKNYRSNFAGSRFNHHSTSSLNHKRVFMGCRKRKAVILPDSPVKTVMDQKQLLQSGSGYNPQNHARRREFTDVLNNLMCEACGLQFKTIILLERHVKHCDKKEKFKTLQPMTSSLDNYFDKKKNMCLYCNKNFTYTKSLLNHFQDFCPVKKTKLDNGELTELEKQKEAEIIERIHKADEEKALKQKEMEARPKRKISWQVGRKSKRKGHSWTNIKKRNQLKGSKGSSEGSEEIIGEVDDADDDDNDDIDETSSDSEDDDDGSDNNGSSPDNNNSSDHNDNDEDVFQADSQEVSNVSEESKDGTNGFDETVKCSNKDEKECDNVSSMEIVNDEKEEIKATNESHEESNEKLKSEKSEPESKVDGNVERNVCEIKQRVEEENEGEEAFKVTDDFANCEEITDKLLSESEQTLKRYSIGNTSLNCTARYKVNDVQLPKKYRPIRPKPTLFRCVSGQLSNSGEPGNAVFEPNPSTANIDHSYQNKMSKVKHQNRMSEDKQVVTQSDYPQMVNTDPSEITGKRRRKQVGKVEEFLKAFRKKNKKKSENTTVSAENDEQATENGNVKCDSLYKNETCQREVNMIREMKLDAPKPESRELDMPNISSNEMNNSGFVSFDLPPGSTPLTMPRKRGRPRKEQKGNSPNKKLGRPPKLFPSVKPSVPNLLKRRVGRPPKLKRENIEMINRTEIDAVIPDVMTNPALTFTHLVKNSEMKYNKDSDLFEKMPEKLIKYPSAGFKDGYNAANNVADVPVDNVVNTNDLGKSNDDDHDIDEVDNYSDPATEPFSDSGDDIDELYQEALNKEQVKANDDEESLKDEDCVECSGSVQKMVQKETNNAETDDSVRTEFEGINNIVNREKFDEIDGGQRANETSNLITSESSITADYKNEFQEADNISQNDALIDEVVNTESETNPESDYKTESECENVTEEEVEDIVENVQVSDTKEPLKDDCKEDGSGIKDSEKDGDSSQDDKNENFDEFMKFEPFLSPSERVKMNKRSCKKDVELTSPVWMKRTKKYIGKGEKKSEYSSKSCDSSSDVEEAVKPNAESSIDNSEDRYNDKTDGFINQSHGVKESQPSKGKKRKMVDAHEKDSKDNTVSKIPRREMKVCSKKNVSSKGKK
ncbi:histone-lysine N-methyltransferase [Mactra antiquata]